MDNELLLQNWLNEPSELSDEELIESGFELFFKDSFSKDSSDEETLKILLL